MRGITNGQWREPGPKIPRIVCSGRSIQSGAKNLSIKDFFGYDTAAELNGHSYILRYYDNNSKNRLNNVVISFDKNVVNGSVSSMGTDNTFCSNSTPNIVGIEINPSTTTFDIYIKRAYVSSSGTTDWATAGWLRLEGVIQIV